MTAEDRQSTAVLLIAHGSRLPAANEDLVRLAEAVRKRGRYGIVEIAYLEIAEPTIPAGARRCVERGAKVVLMLPYFLSAGAHVVDDLERHRGDLSAEFPDVRFTLRPPLGLHPQLIDVVLERLDEVATDEAKP